MTPQERELIAELFDRLASLERNPRDPQAEAAIREGLRDAPNAIYALVQTVLVQDEALKAANARLQQYEGGAPQQGEQRGFLDQMRDSFFGRDEPPRGSVPRVQPGNASPGGVWSDQRPQAGAPMGVPQGYRDDYRGNVWDRGAPPQAAAPQQSAGGSFLGTAAAAAAGAIGGALLMNGIRSAMGGHQQAGPFAGAFDQLSGNNQDRGNPWATGAGTDLSREAGLNDIGGDRRASFADTDQAARPAGLFDNTSNDSGDEADYEDDGDFFGDDDTA